MSSVAHGAASDMGALRMDPADQKSKLAGLDAQELLETRVLKVGGRDQPIKYASIFDRDDNMRVASNAKSFELSTEEVTDIQDRIMAAAGAVGAQKFPIKVQGKEYKLDHVGIDTLVAKSGDETVIAALTGSMVLVFTTESDQVEALEIIARSFVEGLANQGM